MEKTNSEASAESSPEKPKKKMRLWKKILIGIGAFILLIIILAFAATSGITSVAEKQLNLLSSGNTKAAYELTSQEFQRTVSYDDFMNYVNRYAVLKNNKSHNFTSRETNGDTGKITGTLEAKDGTVTPVTYQFIKENKDWKILSLDLSSAAGATESGKGTADSATTPNSSGTNSSATATDAGMNTFSDAALGYSIQYPKDWTMEKKDSVTVLFRGPAEKNMSDVTLDIQNLTSSNRGGKYTDNNDVVKDLKNQVKGMDKNAVFNDITDITFKRSDGLELTAKGFAAKVTVQGKKLVFMYIVVPHGDSLTFHSLEFMSPTDTFDKYSDLLKSILNTWTINK
ncbi:DUF4864 domain-containing protein [bacterium]|nr:MAG: DUF4864 domain-containing protein [bacterium]